jgi:energy-coupling factor transporter ATP-binding protein EcfA2
VPDPTIFGLVVDQLASDPPTVAGSDDLVLAAFEGAASLEASLAGNAVAAASGANTSATRPPTVFLRTVEVEGFRGIGPPVSLRLVPGPGLTLVVGRNGSGKSSIAEALEMLLTGSNQRWAPPRQKVWAEGWRNLHHRPARIKVTLAEDGRREAMIVERKWTDDADLGGSTLTINAKRGSMAETGWDEALRSYPPLLSHNELGRILEGRPSELYDALASILGLANIAEAESLLRNARLSAERLIKDQQAGADQICRVLAAVEDERAAAVVTALSSKTWDLDAVERLATGSAAAVEERTAVRTLRELSTLPVVDREQLREAVARLREMHEELQRIGSSDAAAARDTAVLLEQALKVHAPHEGLQCPVCGTDDVLTYEWRRRTTERITDLRDQARSVEQVHQRAAAAAQQARQLILPPSPALNEAAAVGLDTGEVTATWQRWITVPERDDLPALGTHLDTVGLQLIVAVADIRAAAGRELERREDVWRPAAQQVAAWLPGAKSAVTQRSVLPRLKAAEMWLRGAHEKLRVQRFTPIADQVQENWRELRQSSSVQLGELRLDGTGSSTQRRLTLDVTIDDEKGSALGVMSQGEINCLALSLFLPRASMPESPFRFLVIDDPVQAMDPVKVEGLAQVLGRVSKTRQVIVLTHDERLAEAVRRLEMDATIVEVSRRENSVVELRTDLDPVKRHINDAMALVMSKNLPEEARRVVPGFCRLAMEAACVEAVTKRMVREGKSRTEIDVALDEPTKLISWLALVLFKDAARGGEVMPWLNTKQPGAADVVSLANRGSHVGIPVDLLSLVRAAEKLSARIREMGDGSS